MAPEINAVAELEKAGRAWAKSRFGWLSLVDHSIDVAAVAETLFRLPTVASRLGALAKRDLSDVDVARLGFFIGLHDLGKANHGFQARLQRRKPDCGHIQPVWSILCGSPVHSSHYLLRKRVRKSLTASLWRRWNVDWEAEVEIWNAVLAHHGSLPANLSTRPDPSLWQQRDGYDPLVALSELAQIMTNMFSEAFADEPDETLPDSPRFLHALAGMITLADWLGSDPTVFLCPDKTIPSGEARIPWARQQAADLIKRRWLDPTRARNAARGLVAEFKILFPDLTRPRPAQEALLSMPLPEPGQTTILEAETGSGKTEAALIHFLRLFQSGQVDGLYFALPTRAAAVQIHGRIRAMLRRWFGEATPPVGLAVPGYLRVDEDEGQPLPDTYDVLWPDETDRDRTWAVENAKRYLSGAVMVGTVDQVLMGGLRVRHAPFRSGPMLRLLLCIDEVHASDAYMTTLLRNVLDQHTKSGGHALLMSATLGSQARMRLLAGRIEARTVPGVSDASALHYPSLQRTDEPLQPLVHDGRDKSVVVELIDPESDFPVLLDHLKAAAAAGAAVLFIRNRVDDAQETVRRLEERNTRLLRCEGTIAPHHGRFAPEDRRLLDNALENAFPKGERSGVVAVTTQTAEQSLDICADWLVTDIAPGDVLLQRIGRLHRHQRPRPMGFEDARITVLAPTPAQLAGTLNSRTGSPRGRTLLGLGSVYENIVGVLAVRDWLVARGKIHIPADNRAVVETATHYAALYAHAERLGSIWPTHLQSVEGQRLAEGQGANTVAIRWEEPLIDNQPVSDQRAETRLGLKDHRVKLPEPLLGPFGQLVRTLSIPGWMVGETTEDGEVEVVDVRSHTIRFRFGSRDFRYDRFGLVRVSD